MQDTFSLQFPFILASNSPRRKEILTQAGFQFSVLPSDVDESFPVDMKAQEVPVMLAERKAKALLETSRRTVAKHINCAPSEIIFTSGGTEADNMAIYSAVTQLGVKRIITSAIEHHAVGHTADAISLHEKIELVLVNLDSKGNVDLAHLESLLKENKPTLVSLMHANNEIATMIPLKKVADLCRQYDAYFHSDTVQTMAHYAFDLKEIDIDFITCAAHKFHGPKGIGFLYVNKKTRVSSFIHGGAQERGLRGGTENIAGIVGLAKAMDLAYEDVEGHQKHVYNLKSFMIQELKTLFPTVSFHGETDFDKALYTVLNVCLFYPLQASKQ